MISRGTKIESIPIDVEETTTVTTVTGKQKVSSGSHLSAEAKTPFSGRSNMDKIHTSLQPAMARDSPHRKFKTAESLTTKGRHRIPFGAKLNIAVTEPSIPTSNMLELQQRGNPKTADRSNLEASRQKAASGSPTDSEKRQHWSKNSDKHQKTKTQTDTKTLYPASISSTTTGVPTTRPPAPKIHSSSTQTPKLEASTKTTPGSTQIQTTSSPSAQTSPPLKTHKLDSSMLPTTEHSVHAPKTSPTRANLNTVRIPPTKVNSTQAVRTPPTKKNSANQDVRIPPTAPTVPLYHKLFPNKEKPALSEEEAVIKILVKTDDNGVQGGSDESPSTLEPILGCDKTNATNIRMDDGSKETEAKEEDFREKEGKSEESVEEDGFVLVLDREEDSDGDGSPRQVR